MADQEPEESVIAPERLERFSWEADDVEILTDEELELLKEAGR